MKKNGTILLLDEPANNMHIFPQKTILNILSKTHNENFFIIYSTHSPYLIDISKEADSFSVFNEASEKDVASDSKIKGYFIQDINDKFENFDEAQKEKIKESLYPWIDGIKLSIFSSYKKILKNSGDMALDIAIRELIVEAIRNLPKLIDLFKNVF